MFHHKHAALVLQNCSAADLVNSLFIEFQYTSSPQPISVKAGDFMPIEFDILKNGVHNSQQGKMRIVDFITLGWLMSPHLATGRSNTNAWKLATSASVILAVHETHNKHFFRRFCATFDTIFS